MSNISEDNINHAYEHSVFSRVSGIFNDWNNISSLLSHVHQISTTSVRKLNSVNTSLLQYHKDNIIRNNITLLTTRNIKGQVLLTGPTISDTWETVVPEAAPRYRTLAPGFYIET